MVIYSHMAASDFPSDRRWLTFRGDRAQLERVLFGYIQFNMLTDGIEEYVTPVRRMWAGKAGAVP